MAFAERFVEMPDDVLAEVLRNFDPLAPDFLLSLGAVCARWRERIDPNDALWRTAWRGLLAPASGAPRKPCRNGHPQRTTNGTAARQISLYVAWPAAIYCLCFPMPLLPHAAARCAKQIFSFERRQRFTWRRSVEKYAQHGLWRREPPFFCFLCEGEV